MKVTGNIDAQNNPIKNVGIPQELTDAINGNVLQDAFRDDGPFEYKMFIVDINQSHYDGGYVDLNYHEYIEGQTSSGYNSWNTQFQNILFPLLNEGWKIDQTIPMSVAATTSHYKTIWILKRLIEE